MRDLKRKSRAVAADKEKQDSRRIASISPSMMLIEEQNKDLEE